MVRASIVLLLAAIGCAEDPEHPPPPPPCEDDICVGPVTPPRGGAAPGTGGSAGSDAGTMVPEGGPGGVLQGQVGVYDDDFRAASSFFGSGIVGAQGSAGRVTAVFTDAEYSLAGVVLEETTWVDIEATSSAGELFPTIQPVDARAGRADVAFVQASVMEFIGANLNVTADIDRTRAHAVLRFANPAGGGIVGITVTPPAEATVAYDVGSGLYRDDTDVTGPTGMVALLNMQAANFPGAITMVAFSGVEVGTAPIKLGAGAVTVATITP